MTPAGARPPVADKSSTRACSLLVFDELLTGNAC